MDEMPEHATLTISRAMQARRDLPPPAMRRALREGAGVTLSEVGEACGVTRQCAWLWETGARTPRSQHLVAYVELLRLFHDEAMPSTLETREPGSGRAQGSRRHNDAAG